MMTNPVSKFDWVDYLDVVHDTAIQVYKYLAVVVGHVSVIVFVITLFVVRGGKAMLGWFTLAYMMFVLFQALRRFKKRSSI